jgi:chorismate mutase/prephenate dehydratase
MTARKPEKSLDALREEIDAIDGDLLQLLIRRFEATDRVRASKTVDGSLAMSPLRPAREAIMLRRLISDSRGCLPPDLVVQLWRVILSASIQSQAAVTLHMSKSDEHDMAARITIAQHFFGMKIVFHDGATQVFDRLRERHGDLAIMTTGSSWADSYPSTGLNPPQIVATLPSLTHTSVPQLLVFGHVDPGPSGDDETLLLVSPSTPLPPSALWMTNVGRFVLISVPGLLTAEADFLRDYVSHHPDVRIAGRCPRPIRYEHGDTSA